jgi:hypothetical protein
MSIYSGKWGEKEYRAKKSSGKEADFKGRSGLAHAQTMAIKWYERHAISNVEIADSLRLQSRPLLYEPHTQGNEEGQTMTQAHDKSAYSVGVGIGSRE